MPPRKKKRLRLPTVAEMRAFRDTLPEFIRNEHMTLLSMAWDVTLARWILANYPRDPIPLNVESWARGYGFDKLLEQPEPVSGEPDEEGWREIKVPWTLAAIDVRRALESPEIDITQPVIVAEILLPTGKKTKVLLDGAHRLFKALSLHLETIPCYVLTLEESQLCRVQ